MRIAHLSDLHLLDLAGVPFSRFLNKRLTGWAMLRFHRKSVHKPFAVRAIGAEIQRLGIDHVAVTGDLTNLALEGEFERVRAFLHEDLALPPDRVSVIPGNHDLYTRGSAHKRRFESYFSEYLASDLPELGVDHFGARYPFVKLRGPVAVIGLSSAVPRLPLVASGRFGRAQIEAFSAVLEHPEVKRRTKVILQHHPLHNLRSRLVARMEGLTDNTLLVAALGNVDRGLVLHGHSHIRVRRTLETTAGSLDVVGATSASLMSDDPHRHSGFNLYEIDDATGAIVSMHAHVLNDEGAFENREIPRDTGKLRQVHKVARADNRA